MERLFVYRTIPQLKFQLNKSNSKTKLKKHPHHIYSQKCLKTQNNLEQQKILFKTKNNILIQDYQPQQQQTMNNKSILLPNTKNNKPIKPNKAFNKISINKINQLKFHQLTLNDVSWQKWKRPLSIVRLNRQITHRSSSKNRHHTENNNIIRDQQQSQLAKQQMKEKKIQREIGELNRLKSYIKDKKKVMDLIFQIHSQQEKSVKKTFNTLRSTVQQVCQFYKHQKFNDELHIQRLKSSRR